MVAVQRQIGHAIGIFQKFQIFLWSCFWKNSYNSWYKGANMYELLFITFSRASDL